MRVLVTMDDTAPASHGRPVIVAFDGSPAAQAAVRAAAELFSHHRLLVVTVWEVGLAYTTPVLPGDAGVMPSMVDPRIASDVDTALHTQAEDLARAGAELAASLGSRADGLALADDGEVSDTLLQLAHERQAAAIVVGSRGLSGLRARFEGSTSQHVVKHATCPVLVVHDSHNHQH